MKLWDIYRDRDYHIKPTLERIEKAVKLVGNPQREFFSFLVGGTNGKGSTCAFLERILREQGYRTGWFVSPHLLDERERWRINGELIPKEVLSDYVKDLRPIFERLSLTYFEAATLIALLYFRDMKVDTAVIEVGMGGRWDATKVSEAEIIGITNVERDHTKWLGRSIDQIACEKLHLYRDGYPLILGSARYPLYWVALSMGLKNLIVAGEDYTYGSEVERGKTLLTNFRYRDTNLSGVKLGLLGKWQADNAAMALTMALSFSTMDRESLRKALSATRWEGRMELIRENPLLIVDGSHNPYAISKVVKESIKLFPRIEVVFTGLAGKDWQLSMNIIRRYRDNIYIVQVQHHRGELLSNMCKYAKELNFKSIECLSSAEEVLNIDKDVLVIGSLYLVGEVKEALSGKII